MLELITEKIKFNMKEGGYCWSYKTITWLFDKKGENTTSINEYDLY